jgi:hypothetical protein
MAKEVVILTLLKPEIRALPQPLLKQTELCSCAIDWQIAGARHWMLTGQPFAPFGRQGIRGASQHQQFNSSGAKSNQPNHLTAAFA